MRLGGAMLVASIAATFTVGAFHAGLTEEADLSGATLWGVLAAAFWILLGFAVKRSRGHLLITPDGIHHHGGTFLSHLAWDDVVAILPVEHDGPEVLVTGHDDAAWAPHVLSHVRGVDKPPELPRDDGQPGNKPAIRVRCVYYRVDPALLFAILHFYAVNPHAGVELATEAALHRARAGAFT
jgi:hypothetical protein